MDLFNGKKTYLVAIGTILGAIGGVMTGAVTAADAAQLVVTAIIGMTLRNGISNQQ